MMHSSTATMTVTGLEVTTWTVYVNANPTQTTTPSWNNNDPIWGWRYRNHAWSPPRFWNEAEAKKKKTHHAHLLPARWIDRIQPENFECKVPWRFLPIGTPPETVHLLL